MEAYKKHDFVQAKTKFESLVRAKPDDARAHYYLANTLVFLKEMKAAAREYQTAIENAQSDDIRENSLAALRVLQNAGVKGGDSGGRAAQSAKTNSLGGAPAYNASSSSSAAAASAATSAPDAQSTLERQAEERKDIFSQQAEAAKKKALETGELQAKQISSEHTVDPYVARRNRFGGRAYADAIKEEGEKQAAEARQRAKMQADGYKRYVEEKNAALDQAANNLSDQLNQDSGPGKVRLKREGTNLNVRNYEFGH
jgi:hypothetical protein